MPSVDLRKGEMKLFCDKAKQQATLDERGLDFASVAEVFAGGNFTAEDLRFDCGEKRLFVLDIAIVFFTPGLDSLRQSATYHFNEES